MLTFLWCVPRSVSTAFEKMIWCSGHFEVVSEPFLDLYKRSLLSSNDHLSVQEEIRRVCDKLLEQSKTRQIFVKDMGYHAEPFISDSFIKSINNVFLIRDPRLSIPSLFKMRAEYAESETGFKGQLKLFQRTQGLTGNTPLVLDGEQLKMSPESVVASFFRYIDEEMPKGILSWPVGSRKDWAVREPWHVEAINSQGFERFVSKVDFDSLPIKVKRSIEANTKYYEEMYQYVASN